MGGKYLPSLFPNGRYRYVVKLFGKNITFGIIRMEMLINAIGRLDND